MFDIPIHIKKLTEDYQAGKIAAEDVTVTGNPEVPESLEFEFKLPLFSRYGEALGEFHQFKLTVESLVSSKALINGEADKLIGEVDAFNTLYDSTLALLDDVKARKEASGDLKPPENEGGPLTFGKS